MTDLFAEELV